ncbi:prepilin-type N-terminal cleavage/methylation domain-containing protein [Neorhodopirellula pilleata]|uniref:prepilin-type N-terminal cleavage/methylation domain-containing protein n=1 Tax=Neorhodopirellula pilleata TaxID=2714738 RepID=UPI001E5BCADF|nr:prepilin-type N-terminal cleavage/methylation domain-containing protein [Neorhodopirellula pilleata]
MNRHSPAGSPLSLRPSLRVPFYKRNAFSLLEMILALALLGTSLGILAQVALTGTDAATEAEHLSQARMIAQSHLAEILAAGITPAAVPPSPTASMDSASTTAFQYQVDVVPAPMDGMLAIRVSVEALDEDGGAPLASYSATRWMIDPALGLAEMAAEEAAVKSEE